MADERSRRGSAAAEAEVHDDDELAEVLAAELERYATGTVPIVQRLTQPTPAPPPAEPMQPLAVPQIAAVPEPPRRSARRTDGRRAAEIERALAADGAGSFRRPAGAESAEDRPAGRIADLAASVSDEQPLRRRSGFRPPPEGPAHAEPRPVVEPLDRVLRTGPISLPESTAALLGDMIGEQAERRSARHAAPLPQVEAPPPDDALPSTGPLAVPRGLYTDWEQSLRSIGRPPAPWEEDDELVGGAPVDAPTVALAVHPAAPTTVGDEGRAVGPDLAAAVPKESGRGRSDRRHALQGTGPGEAPPPPRQQLEVVDVPTADAEGIDEVEAPHAQVSAATTGAIELPSVEPKPRTGPVLMGRVRTAILQLPAVPASATGTGAPAVVGRWVGAFASPLLLLLGFGLAGVGTGPGAIAALVLGVLIALPAAGRSAAWAARTTDDGAMQETALLGRVTGRVAAVVLLLARLAAAAAAVLAIAGLLAAWATRTGALGGSASSTAILAAGVVGVLATGVAALPARAAGVLVLLLGALGVVGTVLLALVLAPGAGAGAPGTAAGPVAAGAAGFSTIGLLLVLCGPDVARWRTDLPRAATSVVATVLAAAAGAAVLAGATLIGASAGAGRSGADRFADALVGATAAALATPLGVVLLASSLVLPVLLVRSAGAAAARLVDTGRSVRLGSVAAGLLALAASLALLAAAPDTDPVLLAVAGGAGVPVAAWAGVILLAPGGTPRRVVPVAVVLLVAVLAGWSLTDGLVPGGGSPVLDALGLGAGTGLRGGPAVGLAAALVVGLAAGAVARTGGTGAARPARSPADTVEG